MVQLTCRGDSLSLDGVAARGLVNGRGPRRSRGRDGADPTHTVSDVEGGATGRGIKKVAPRRKRLYDNLKGFKLLCDNASHLENLV